MMKVFLSALLISLFLSQSIQANTKYDQYNGDMPFIEMMLNMMVAMGMIDKVAPYLVGYSNYYNNQPWYMENAFSNQYPMHLSGVPGYNMPPMVQGINSGTMQNVMVGSPRPLMNQRPCGEYCGNHNPVRLNGVWIPVMAKC